MTKRGRPLQRMLASALRTPLALACLAAHLAATAHFALTPHEVCAEHGEAVHAGEADTHSAPRAPHDGAPQRMLLALGAQDAHLAHAHCPAANTHREDAVVHASGVALGVAPASGAASPHADRLTLNAPIAVLSLAPKLSPPA